MFVEILDALDNGTEPMETFYDGYVVNAIIDACYKSAKSKQWEPVELEDWRGATGVEKIGISAVEIAGGYTLVKEERMPDGRLKQILRDKESGAIVEKIAKS